MSIVTHRFLVAGAGLLAALLALFSPAPVPAVQAQSGFYVAVAPYVTQTHPCTYHVKGSCQGELSGASFRYWLRATDGTVGRTGTAVAGADGFIEWWLPHNKKYVVTFAYNAMRGTGTFSSFPKDPTCITTIQLRRGNS